MLEIDNQTTINICTTKLEDIASVVSGNRLVELLLVDLEIMQDINRTYRGKNRPTDVLSFPLDSMGMDYIPLGSVVICMPIAEKMSKVYKHSLEDEVSLLLIHGILHLQGYDHENDDGLHRRVENQWINYFNLPSSLIVRVLDANFKITH